MSILPPPSPLQASQPPYTTPSSYLTRARFHRSLTLPPSTTPNNIHPKLRVTFAVCGAGVDDLIIKDDPTGGFKSQEKQVPTILYCSGMFGSRYQGVLGCDFLGRVIGVRIVFVDRPGLGGSTPVDVPLRIPVWLETVPVLMDLLGAKHVALVSHSCGSLYLLNTLYHFRHILSPTKPYVALMAPWIHPSQSHKKLLRTAYLLPTPLIQKWSSINSFIYHFAAPAFNASSTFIFSLSSLLSCNNKNENEELTEEELLAEELTGQTWEVRNEIGEIAMRYIFKEDTSAVNGEAVLCLKKLGVGYWGVCEDLERFVEMLVELERERRGDQHSKAEANPEEGKLKIETFFGETDRMIGKGGEAFFKNCFRQEVCGEVLEFESMEVELADHDSVANVWMGPFKRIFEEAKGGLI